MVERQEISKIETLAVIIAEEADQAEIKRKLRRDFKGSINFITKKTGIFARNFQAALIWACDEEEWHSLRASEVHYNF